MKPKRPAPPADGGENNEQAPASDLPETEETAAADEAADAEPDLELVEDDEDGNKAEERQDAELATLRAESDRLLRLLAERDNQLRRVRREQERDLERFRGELVEKLLPVIDDFQRALEQLPEGDDSGLAEGLRLVAGRLEESLAELGLEPIEAVGATFDPRFHEALLQLPNTDAEKGVVVQELQRGYRLGERVIRPSKVAVAG